MSHTYYCLMAHCVFATKERRILIPPDLKKKLWPYMAGIARTNKINKQEAHHRKMSFDEELLRMLERHGITPYPDSRN